MAQSVIPGMRRLGRGSIAWAIPSTNVPVYVTAKAAIVGMTARWPTNSGLTTFASTA